MQQPKNITIQVWTDNYYCRIIGIWRPHEEPGAIPQEPDPESPTKYIDETRMNLPRYIVLSSVFEPRQETMGHNPVAPSQHPIPKDFLDDQTRQISYMFANDMGIFTPPTKAAAATFMAQQTVGYKKKKEIKRTVRPASGTMTLKELRQAIDQYTPEEQEKIPVMIMGEHPNDTAKKNIDDFIHNPKSTGNGETIPQYISVTKITPVYVLEDPYINNSPLDSDQIQKSLPPGTEDAPMSVEATAGTIAAVEENQTNKEVLQTFDEMNEAPPEPILDEDGNPVVDENGEPMMKPKPELDRLAVLEELLKKKTKQLIDAGLQEPPIQTQSEPVPEPVKPYFDDNGQSTLGTLGGSNEPM